MQIFLYTINDFFFGRAVFFINVHVFYFTLRRIYWNFIFFPKIIISIYTKFYLQKSTKSFCFVRTHCMFIPNWFVCFWNNINISKLSRFFSDLIYFLFYWNTNFLCNHWFPWLMRRLKVCPAVRNVFRILKMQMWIIFQKVTLASFLYLIEKSHLQRLCKKGIVFKKARNSGI